MKVEAATISEIELSKDYPFVRVVRFKDRKYQVVLASTKDYSVGEDVLFIPGDARLPEWFLKHIGFWDYKEDHGLLSGKDNDVVVPFNYAGNSNYFSYGMFVRLDGNQLTMPDGEVVSLYDTRLGDKIGITYLTHGIPYYLKGEYFFMDINTHKENVPDLEVIYKLFENEDVQYEEYVSGRKFYVSIFANRSHHRALGPDHNIFVTSNIYNKHAYLSRSTQKETTCVTVTLLEKYHIVDNLSQYIHYHPRHGNMTLEFILLDYAFANKFQLKETMLCLTDIYVGNEPWGRYMNKDDKKELEQRLRLYSPKVYGSGVFSYEEAERLLGTDKQAIIVRSLDNSKRAVLYSHKQRLNRKHRLH